MPVVRAVRKGAVDSMLAYVNGGASFAVGVRQHRACDAAGRDVGHGT